MNKISYAIAFMLLSVSTYTFAGVPDDSVYLDGGENTRAMILAHGKGKHPTWFVVDPVRKEINKELGYHTLSLQMPTSYSEWQDYAHGFPIAYNTIKGAITYLKNERGVSKVFLFGHSMGARMASAFVSEYPDSGLSGLIVAGCRNNGDRPLACDQSLKGVVLPVLDIWGGNNGKDYRAASARKDMISGSYTQVEISGANHKFEGYEDELVDAVANWLKKQN